MTKHSSQIDNHFCPGTQRKAGSWLICVVFGTAFSALMLSAWSLSILFEGSR